MPGDPNVRAVSIAVCRGRYSSARARLSYGVPALALVAVQDWTADTPTVRALDAYPGGWQSWPVSRVQDLAVASKVRRARAGLLGAGYQPGDVLLSFSPVRWDTAAGQWTRPALHLAAGGNYGTGDSRLSDLIQHITGHRFYGAIAIHDYTDAGLNRGRPA